MPLTIGIDLCDDYITAYGSEDKVLLHVPAVVCREKKDDLWYIGESAYRMALSGKGVLTDRLLSLLKKGGTSTISRRSYTAEQLISRMLASVLWQILNGRDLSIVDRLVIALHKPEKDVMDAVMNAAESTGVERSRIRIISHAEAFAYYTLAQEKDLYSNMVGLFDLSDESLSYYRLKVMRGISRNSVIVEGTDLEEAFHIGILKKESGSELGDRIMTDAAKKCLGNDIFSSVFLTGRGFERTDWAKNFIAYICKRRRVMYEKGLFAIGAAELAEELFFGEEKPYLIFCDTRVAAEVSMDVMIREHRSRLILIPPGQYWYGAGAYAEVMPRGQDYLDIVVEPMDRRESSKAVRMRLDEFPKRPDRCTKIAVEVDFTDAEHLRIRLTDLGFGEIFPASGTVSEEVIHL
ncbi:MAG: hypothetical protein IJR62_08970 [Lachnospiraceae bacterium]|jgi:hypothetical protein|nr:hypothetical protein [Lachnospiraceae bacterium]